MTHDGGDHLNEQLQETFGKGFILKLLTLLRSRKSKHRPRKGGERDLRVNRKVNSDFETAQIGILVEKMMIIIDTYIYIYN